MQIIDFKDLELIYIWFKLEIKNLKKNPLNPE